MLYDSRVICEYLNGLGDGHLLPREGNARWSVLVEQSLADGICDAAVLTRYETFARPEPLRWKEWIAGQLEKVNSGLDLIEARAAVSATASISARSPSAARSAISTSASPRSGGATRARSAAAWFERFGARRFDGRHAADLGFAAPDCGTGNAAARRDIQWS